MVNLPDKGNGVSVKVFDFFSGCGGASCGFMDAGMEIVFALDFDPDSRRTYQTNFPSTHYVFKNIRKTPISEVRSIVDAQRPNPLLFCGCAPCQPFTRHNRKQIEKEDDDRKTLLSRFAEFVEACKPDIVFIENVAGLEEEKSSTGPFGEFLQSLRSAGYDYIKYSKVRAMKYGIPQCRCRLVLLASRHGPIELPSETNGPGTDNPSYETVRNWIGNLPPIEAGDEHETFLNHRAARLSELNLERIRATPEGGGRKDWPERFRLECHNNTTGYSDVYGRMAWDRPATALTTRCISYSNGRFGHPDQDRAISIREAACLQTFPRDFKFEGSLASMARQIGNAVPVRLATIIGQHINRHLKQVGVLA